PRFVGAFEGPRVGCRGQTTLDVLHDRSERRIARGHALALDQDFLSHVLRKGSVDRGRRAAGLADSALRLFPIDRRCGVLDDEHQEHEPDPAPDRELAMLGAPPTGSRGEVPRRRYDVHVHDFETFRSIVTGRPGYSPTPTASTGRERSA